ncbi:unnamed protein product [Clavelina lepadiformis]|uniref:RRM domain-containing protein n=1 Tax=Clavelina lepadiformis TaxID=159417 RepID=A0ABP0FD80_CLALP
MDHGDIGARIFVGGLDHSCDEMALEKSFQIFGDITQVLIMKDRETKRSRGFGFISFLEPASAEDAIRRMHGVEIMGRCVTVRKAEKQGSLPDRPRREGFRSVGNRGYNHDNEGKYGTVRGRGYETQRRQSTEAYQERQYGDARNRSSSSYVIPRREGFDTARLGYKSTYDDRRGNDFDNSNNAFYDSSSRSAGYREVLETTRSYDDPHRRSSSDAYMETRRDSNDAISRSYTSHGIKEGFDNVQYSTRWRSRSPMERYSSKHEESPVSNKRRRMPSGQSGYGGNFQRSPNEHHLGRQYSPSPVGGRGYSSQEMTGQDRQRGYHASTYRGSPHSSHGDRSYTTSSNRYGTSRKNRGVSPLKPKCHGNPGSFRSNSPIESNEYSSSRSQFSGSRTSRYAAGGELGVREKTGQRGNILDRPTVNDLNQRRMNDSPEANGKWVT